MIYEELLKPIIDTVVIPLLKIGVPILIIVGIITILFALIFTKKRKR